MDFSLVVTNSPMPVHSWFGGPRGKWHCKPHGVKPRDANDRLPVHKPLQGEDVGELKEQTGKIAPLPEHDGTDCLKWDDSLWSHADHFKVC